MRLALRLASFAFLALVAVPSWAQQAPTDTVVISLDSIAEASLVADQTDAYQFPGTAGQRVTLALDGPGFSSYLYLELYRPDGTRMLRVRSGSFGSSALVETAVVTLPEAGAYVALVYHSNAAASGAYTLAVSEIEIEATLAFSGERAEGTVSTARHNDRAYATFEGTAGDVVRVYAEASDADTGEPSRLTFRLRAPNVDAFTGTPLSDAATSSLGLGQTDILTLPETGTYTVEVDPSGTDVAAATVGVLRPEVQPITLGEDVAETVADRTAFYRYTLRGTASLGLAVRADDDVDSYLYTSIFAPDGTKIAENRSGAGSFGGPYETGPVTLPTTGSYEVRMDPLGSGTFTMRAESQSADPIASAAPWRTVTGSIERAGQNRYFTFDGVAGEAVTAEIEVGAAEVLRGTIRLRRLDDASDFLSGRTISDPLDGITTATFGPGEISAVTAVLPETGRYAIDVDGRVSADFGVGAFALRFSQIAPSGAITVGTSGSATTGFARLAARAITEGGVITIEAGALHEVGGVYLSSDGVTLRGAGRDATTLTLGGNGARFNIDANAVTLEDLTLVTGTFNSALKLFRRGGGGAPITGFVFREARLRYHSGGLSSVSSTKVPGALIENVAFGPVSGQTTASGAALNLRGDGVTVRGVKVHTGTDEGGSTGLQITGNRARIIGNTLGSDVSGSVSNAIRVLGDSAYVAENTVAKAGGAAITVTRPAQNTTIDTATVIRNTVAGNYTDGVRIEWVRSALVSANHFPGYPDADRGIWLRDAGGRVENNRVTLRRFRGLYYTATQPDPPAATFANNAVRHSQTYTFGGGFEAFVQDNTSADETAPVTLINNILAAPARSGANFSGVRSDAPLRRADYNLVEGYAEHYAGEAVEGANDRHGDPLFVGDTFALEASSPALDAGTPDGAPTTDFRGTPRPLGGGVDIGPFESAETATSVTATFAVDLSMLRRTGAFDPAREVAIVTVFDGTLAGTYALEDVGADSVFAVDVFQESNATVQYAFGIDLDGSLLSTSDRIYELRGAAGGRTRTLPSRTKQASTPVFDDAALSRVAPGARVQHRERFPANTTRRQDLATDTTDTYLTLRTSGPEQALVVGVLRYAEDPGGAPPAGIVRVASQGYWRIEALSASDPGLTDLSVRYEQLSGIVDPSALRLVRRLSPDAPWQTVPSAVDAARQTLTASALTSLRGEWAVGTVTTANTLEGSAPGLVSLPEPENGSTLVLNRAQTTLSWNPARDGGTYTVYLWPDGQPRPDDPLAVQTETSLRTAVDYGTTYRWQVIAENAYGVTPGPEWTFSVSPLPDLVVTEVIVPPSALTEQEIEVRFTVQNAGSATAAITDWTDYLFFSSDTDFRPAGRRAAGYDFVLTATLGAHPNRGAIPNITALEPGETYTATATVTIPRDVSGRYYIFVKTDGYFTPGRGGSPGRLTESDEDNNFAYAPIELSIRPHEDLAVASFNVGPETVIAGETINYDFTVENIGDDIALRLQGDRAAWRDYVFLSRDRSLDFVVSPIGGPQGQDGDRRIVMHTYKKPVVLASGEKRATQDTFPLGPGDTYRRTGSVELPRDFEGTVYVFALIDGFESVYEYSGEGNNIAIDSITVVPRPAPDLVITGLGVRSLAGEAVTSATSGDTLLVSVTAKNVGAGEPTESYWHDFVYLSENADLIPDDATQLGFEVADARGNVGKQIGTLLPDSSYVQEFEVVVPDGISGAFFLHALLDGTSRVFERGEAEDNNSASAPLAVALRTYPDLAVTSVDVPADLRAGLAYDVTWRVENSGGPTPMAVQWHDAVYVSPTPSLGEGARCLGVFEHRAPVAAGERYRRTAPVTLPNDLGGALHFIVQTNARADACRSRPDDEPGLYETEAARADNTQPTPTPVQVAPYPEVNLTVQNLSAPDAALAHDTFTVTWDVTNTGAGRTQVGAWSDRLYLSPDGTTGQGAVLLWAEQHTGALDGGAAYARQAEVTLPHGVEGRYQLVAQVLAGDYRSGANRTGDTDETDDTAARALTLTLPDPANLIVSAFETPGAGRSGQPITIRYAGHNDGTGATPAERWYDRLYISRNPAPYAGGTTYRLAERVQAGPVSGGGTYRDTVEVDLPGGIPSGSYYVILDLDGRYGDLGNDGYVYESNETDNLRSAPIAITLPDAVDLVVTDVQAPTEAEPGDQIEVTWTVDNTATNPAQGRMRDAVYLSTDATWDLSDPLLNVTDRTIDLPGSGSGKTHPSVVTSAEADLSVLWRADEEGNLIERLPGVAPGEYYVIVRTNVRRNIRERDYANNAGASDAVMSVTVRALPLDAATTDAVPASSERYARVAVPEDRDVRLTLTTSDPAVAQSLDLYDASGRVARQFDFDRSVTGPDQPRRLYLPSSESGEHYVLVVNTTNREQDYTLLAEAIDYEIERATPSTLGNDGEVTVAVRGGQLQSTAAVLVRSADGLVEIAAQTLRLIDPTEVLARFDLDGLATGTYDLVARDSSGTEAVLPGGVSVERATGFEFVTSSSGPGRIFRGNQGRFTVTIENTGNVNLPHTMVTFYMSPGIVDYSERNPAPGIITEGVYPSPIFDATPNFPYNSGQDNFFYAGLAQVVPVWMRELRPGETQAFTYATNLVARDPYYAYGEVGAVSREQFVIDIEYIGRMVRHQVLVNTQFNGTPLRTLADDREAFAQAFVERYRALSPELGESGFESETIPLEPTFHYAMIEGYEVLADLAQQFAPGVSMDSLLNVTQGGPSDVVGLPSEDARTDASASTTPVASLGGVQVVQKFTKTFGLRQRKTDSGIKDALKELAKDPGACVWIPGVERGLQYSTLSDKKTQCEIDDEYQRQGKSRLLTWRDPDLEPPPPTSGDPNDIIGPEGFGEENWTAIDRPLPYMIRFENDPLLADAAARFIRITQTLDTDLDARTIRLGAFGFANQTFEVPPGRAFYQTRLDVRDSLGVFVDLTAGINTGTGEAFWIFQAVDPATGAAPTDPDIGLLPVNDSTHIGEGFVSYTVRPVETVETGARVDAQARIIFDDNGPIDTPAIFNTLDAEAPSSQIAEVRRGDNTSALQVSWTAADTVPGPGKRDAPRSGLASYTLFVSTDGGPFIPYQTGLTDTTTTFAGEPNRSYGFFVRASDSAGNTEAPKFEPEATATLSMLVAVYPGDTNDDGVVDEQDVLPIGTYFGQRGPARENASTQFREEPAPTWRRSAATFADANGDGEVDQNDLLPLSGNFGRMRGASKQGQAAESTFRIRPLAQGQTFPLFVDADDEAALTGIAVALRLPPTLELVGVEPGSELDHESLLRAEKAGEGGVVRFAYARPRSAEAAETGAALAVVTLRARQAMSASATVEILALGASDATGVLRNEATTLRLRSPESDELPTAFTLEHAYPNPFLRDATLRFGLPEAADVTVELYDVLGRRVRVLAREDNAEPGWHAATVDGHGLAAGVYFVRLRAGAFQSTRKLIRLR